MASDSEARLARAAQVGFVMRSYREVFSEPGRRRGLSQDELLRRMAEVDESYGRRFSHATVTRWEAGTTRPNVQRLRIFGKALNLSETEVEGLIVLAGLAPDFETAREHMGGSVSFPDPVEEAGPSRDPSTVSRMAGAGGGEPAIPAFLRAALRRLAFRLLLPALYVVVGGYALSAMGWNDDWMPLAYLMVTSLLVMTQTFVWPDRREDLGDLYWASMFILLACPPSGSLRWGWTSTASTESAIWPEPICLTC